MAGFAKTLATMTAGAAMTAGGFVVATALPQIRGALGGQNAFADVLRQPDSVPADGLPPAPAFKEPLSSAPTFGEAGGFGQPAPAADTFAPAADVSAFGPPPAAGGGVFAEPQPPPPRQPPAAFDSATFGAATEFGAAADFGSAPPAEPPVQQASPADSVPANPAAAWADHVAGLKKAGVKDFQILPAGVGMVRMIVWLKDGPDARVDRQLQGQGETPTAAAAAALEAVEQFRSSAGWLE